MKKKASIFKDDKGYVLFPMSKTIAGFWISTEPKLRIYKNDFNDKMVPALFEVLNASKERVPNPKPLSDEEKLSLKKELKTLGLKSFPSLDKKPVLHFEVEMENEIITLIPSQHFTNRKGYTSTTHQPLTINAYANNLDILKIIDQTFEKCE